MFVNPTDNQAQRQFIRLLLPHRRKLPAQVLVAVLLVAMEGLGLGSVLTLLGAGAIKIASLSNIPGITALLQVITTLSLATRIRLAALTLLTFTAARCGLQYIQNRQGLTLRRKVERNLQTSLLALLHEMPIAYLQKERMGELLTIVTHHPRQIGQLMYAFSQAIAFCIILAAYMGLALYLSWPMTLLTIALMIPVSLFLRPLMGNRLRISGHAIRNLTKGLSGIIQENLAAMKIIRQFNRTEWSLRRIQQKIHDFQQADLQAGLLNGLSRPLFLLLNTLALTIILLAASFLLAGEERAVISRLIMFLMIVFRLMPAAGSFAAFLSQLTQCSPIFEELAAFEQSARQTILPNGNTVFSGLQNEIAFEQVCFRHSADTPAILKDISLRIPCGQVTAIVGASGAGKSSLVNLLTRLYDPTSGQVRLDGTDLRRFDIGSWRKRIAVVSQDVFLFHASIWDNLRFARPDATEDEIIYACRQAQAHEFIEAMPSGYDTVVQERGSRLSGGQRQRIALARALLIQNADLLILDEATSEIDVPTEEAIHQTLQNNYQNKTVLIIAHRMSVVRRAHQIYVLERGRVIEHGTHDDLLQLGRVYAQLAHSYSQKDAEE
jgi:ATP-binding cassette, subfamily B, bacterial MsbA